MADVRRPVPDPESAPYWRAAALHRLVLQRCAACAAYRFPPSPSCPDCRSTATDWVEASGRGRIYSWIVVEHPVPAEVFADAVPYVVALVELDEGVRLATNIVDCAADAIRAELPVEVVFHDLGDGLALPLFRPRQS